MYALTTSELFSLDPEAVRLDGLGYTDEGLARSLLGLDVQPRPNVFRVRTTELEGALAALPAVRAARVEVRLPDRLQVTVEERAPIMTWRRGSASLLVDMEGRLFAAASGDAGGPVISDMRTAVPALTVGERLADLDLQVARILGAVAPADLGSSAASVSLTVTDEAGWVMEADGWRAIFGHYTAALRPPSTIEAQVDCLRGLLATGESAVEEVTLSLSSERCGTFRPRPTAKLTPSPGPGASPGRRP